MNKDQLAKLGAQYTEAFEKVFNLKINQDD